MTSKWQIRSLALENARRATRSAAVRESVPAMVAPTEFGAGLSASAALKELPHPHCTNTFRPPTQTKKRLFLRDDNEEEEEDEAATTTTSDASEDPQERTETVPVVKKHKRKPSHVHRREAKEKLLDEINVLQQRAALLREQAGLPDYSDVVAVKDANATLEDTIRKQRLLMANAQSMFSEYATSQVSSPIGSFIRLAADWRQRRKSLLALKEQEIRSAQQFLYERTRFMDPLKPVSEKSRFETSEGDFFVVALNVTQFDGSHSVKTIFEALQFYFFNMEIMISEMSGFITVREDDNEDLTDKSVVNYRLVTSTPSGLLVEKNTVTFLDNSGIENAKSVDDESALIVMDFVDEDELYPYCPSERIRKDVTSVIKLSTHRRKKPKKPAFRTRAAEGVDDDDEEEEEDERIVVVTRYFTIKTHRAGLEVASDVMVNLCEDVTCAVDMMIRSMKQGVFPSL